VRETIEGAREDLAASMVGATRTVHIMR